MSTNHDSEAPPGHEGLRRTKRQFILAAFDRYERQLTAYALKFYGGRKGDLDSARDAVQFTFMQLCQQCPQELSNRLAPWLYTVCRNRIFDDQAKRKLRSSDGQRMELRVSRESDPADICQRNDMLDRIPVILHSLPDRERAVVELWSEGLKPKEIAEVLQRPAGRVRVQLHRAIKLLQQHPEVRPWLERATSQPTPPVDQSIGNSASQVRK